MGTRISGAVAPQVEVVYPSTRKGALVFGGSRVRGNARFDVDGNVVSDLDVGVYFESVDANKILAHVQPPCNRARIAAYVAVLDGTPRGTDDRFPDHRFAR